MSFFNNRSPKIRRIFSMSNARKQGPHRDEVKVRKELDAKRQEMAATMNNVCNALIGDHTLWNRPEFECIRKLTYHAANDPKKYPPPPGINGVASDRGSTRLSENFVAGVFRGDITCRQSINYNPILHIIRISTKFTETNLSTLQMKEVVKRVTLHAADGCGNLITIKVASQNNGHIGVVKTGSVIMLRTFQTLIVDYCTTAG